MSETLMPTVARPAITGPGAAVALPAVIVDAGPAAVERFLEFFAAAVANARTRAAYARAAGQFLAWCATRGLALRQIAPLHVAAYIRTHPGSAPTVKQHLAAIRMLGDWLVVSQVLPVNPAAAVRGPKHVVTKGATPVLSPAEARRLLEAIDTGTLAGLRDRALVSVMLYSFARVSAVIGMRRQDYFWQESRGWLRLHEKGGKRHDVPAHHRAAEALDDYLELAGLDEAKAPLFQSVDPAGRRLTGRALVAASRPGHDQAARGGRGSAALDLLPHVPGDGDHGVSVERGDTRARAADRRARVAEDDEALRPDSGHDHRRRDRTHRDLGPEPRRHLAGAGPGVPFDDAQRRPGREPRRHRTRMFCPPSTVRAQRRPGREPRRPVAMDERTLTRAVDEVFDGGDRDDGLDVHNRSAPNALVVSAEPLGWKGTARHPAWTPTRVQVCLFSGFQASRSASMPLLSSG